MEEMIRQWMWNELNANPHDYFDSAGEPNYMQLVEQAIRELAGDDYESWFVGGHPVWELSIQVLDDFAPQYRQTDMAHRFAVRINGSYQVFRKVEGYTPNREEFTNWLLSYMEYGLELQGNDFARNFSEEVYAVAKQLPILELSKKLKDMTVNHYAYGYKGEGCSLPSPFTNFVLYGLQELIDWDEVALAVSEKAREQMQFN